MSLSYSEFPVYIGGAGISSPPPEVDRYVPATQANVNYNTNHSPKENWVALLLVAISLALEDRLLLILLLIVCFSLEWYRDWIFTRRKPRQLCYHSTWQWSL